MMRARMTRYGLLAFDVLLVAGVALVPILAWRGIRLVEFGALPLLAAPFVWRRVALDRNDWLVVALFGQYALLVTANLWLYPVMPGATAEVGTKVSLYLGAALALLLMVLRFRMTIRLGQVWRVVAPLAILASVAMLGWDHITAPPGDRCRVGFLSKHLLIPPLWLTVLAVASYHGWRGMARWEVWLRHLALALVIMSTVGLAGGRAMLIAQAVTVPILALLLGWGEPLGRRIRIVAVLGIVSFAGLAGGLAVDYRAGCDFSDRLVAIVQTFGRGEKEAEELAERAFAEEFTGETDSQPQEENAEAGLSRPRDGDRRARRLAREERLVGSVYIRPLLWQQAVERIADAPLLGYGHINEPALIRGDFPHFHQQYLSWLVWGGPLMLASGLAMLFAPLLTFGVRASPDRSILALAMIAPLAVSFLAATNLLHTVMLLGYTMTLALLHALAREHVRTEGGATSSIGYMARSRHVRGRTGT